MAFRVGEGLFGLEERFHVEGSIIIIGVES